MSQKRQNQVYLEEKFLTKTQEAHYQKDFKQANRIYESVIKERNRS